MNAVHLHLMLNHIPVILVPASLVVWAFVVWKKNPEWERLALGLVAVSGLSAMLAFLTGLSAEDVMITVFQLPEDLVEDHEKVAKIAWGACLALGGAASWILLRMRRAVDEVSSQKRMAVAVLGFIAVVCLGWASYLGGMIRHPELTFGSSEGGTSGEPMEAEPTEEDIAKELEAVIQEGTETPPTEE